MICRLSPRMYGPSVCMRPLARSLANLNSLRNGPSPALIGPLVKRRQPVAPPPPRVIGAISSIVHSIGCWPATLSGGVTGSGGEGGVGGVGGATEAESEGGAGLWGGSTRGEAGGFGRGGLSAIAPQR